MSVLWLAFPRALSAFSLDSSCQPREHGNPASYVRSYYPPRQLMMNLSEPLVPTAQDGSSAAPMSQEQAARVITGDKPLILIRRTMHTD